MNTENAMMENESNENMGVQQETSQQNPPEGIITNMPEEGMAPWGWNDNMPGEGKRPEWLMDKYSSVEAQAKANLEAQKYIGQLNQRLGIHKGAPQEYDFSAVEDENFQFDKQDPLFNEFITMARDNNVSQEYVNKTLGLAKKLFEQPERDVATEVEAYGADYDQDEKQITNWIKNNNTDELAEALMGEITNAKALRALKNCMNNGITFPTQNESIPQETLKDLQKEFVEDLNKNNRFINNPDKGQEWVERFKKFTN